MLRQGYFGTQPVVTCMVSNRNFRVVLQWCWREKMYPEIMVIPMREELTRLGVKELRTVAEVDQAIPNKPGTTMGVVNSICGCAAGKMRPGVRLAMQNAVKPDQSITVFAGTDREATE